MSNRRIPFIVRFWSQVRKTDTCWIWVGWRDRDGYGRINNKGRGLRTHRASWELHNGPIPEGLCVLHDCPDGDNPSCVNPAHLWLGTNAENTADKMRKGRHPRGDAHSSRLRPERMARGDRNGSRTHPERLRRGESHGMCKLKSDQVTEIRQRFSGKHGEQSALARQYCVSVTTIWNIIHKHQRLSG